ncbi:hypothetical protein B0O99DRAFT_682393 [Bisporella sp. PMI_857]|nr:hypothetical protein B0O99DRAFT_682393 [Bisporella sp. PMI_857]
MPQQVTVGNGHDVAIGAFGVLSVKCSYMTHDQVVAAKANGLPPIDSVVPGFIGIGLKASLFPMNTHLLDIERQISTQALRILSQKHTSVATAIDIYFRVYHIDVPVLHQATFCQQIQDAAYLTDSHFAILLLSVFLFTHLSAESRELKKDADILYSMIKRMLSFQQAEHKSIESVQAAVLVAVWEHSRV